LGLQLQNGRVAIHPHLPRDWDFVEAEVKGLAGTLKIHVEVENVDRIGDDRVEIIVNGELCGNAGVPIPTDGSTHHVRARVRPVRR
jgi:cyclic beta-1,2-glucan synthetase